ncbi:glutamate synthase (NADPH/NADH) large chain [Desulfomicrobium norvegicum]|uniref:Glutamate synthase (NADPH/NADH) large chain n=1 Tax=Desulfomicrobium norvegicum (strain DSM 1741 / NCIMB 8310) TaxID=52561 RepID=A0A8G2C2E0_DESNO|nr:glutamate synthase-related protein [Desulfomicrobium norvegicum]SFL64392.1 glutamate synthase (NADPH/NADH) large chain [Desulfomicrobium norvegicum]
MNRPHLLVEERDACAIIAFVDKRGRATHANIVKTIDALKKMAHRSGDINSEGDGCGILTDIPRSIWGQRLEDAGLSRHLSESRGFFVGHFFLPMDAPAQTGELKERLRAILTASGAETLLEVDDQMHPSELGPMARTEAPLFLQICGLVRDDTRQEGGKRLFNIQMELERDLPEAHVCSLSLDSVIYKLRGTPDLLIRVYPDLQNPDSKALITLGHSRYSTNTLPTAHRAQPFSLLGHNGEINTIEKLRSSARALGIMPTPGGSDSQDLNRILEGLIHVHGFEFMEALEMVFPAIHTEVERMPADLRRMYGFYRWFFAPSAQGPAAVVSRFGDMCMGSVDALGLRPLWFGESDYDYFLSSEKGVVDLQSTIHDPRPLAPGEKIAIISGAGKRGEVLDYCALQERLKRLFEQGRLTPLADNLHGKIPESILNCPEGACHELRRFFLDRPVFDDGACPAVSALLAAFGWHKYDQNMRKHVAATGKGPIGSMGHQGPLSCMDDKSLSNVSDYFKENVAVVTNPAIDREREAEHFSTAVILGDRPDNPDRPPVGLRLRTPILLGGEFSPALSSLDILSVCREHGTHTLEQVLDFFTAQQRDPSRMAILDATYVPDQGLAARLDELEDEASQAVGRGAAILVLDDSASFVDGRVYIDPGLTVARLHRAAETGRIPRLPSLIVRSGAIRNLHDIMFMLGLGAAAVNPYMLWKQAYAQAESAEGLQRTLSNTLTALQTGVEKIMSTMGIHELCGYGRIFSSIGLKRELEEVFGCANFCSSASAGLGYTELEAQGRKRAELVRQGLERKLAGDPKRNARTGKILRSVAVGKTGYLQMGEALDEVDRDNPVGLRHLLDIATRDTAPLPLENVDISIGRHSMPILICAMSFGSQGESSFRAYAEAARKTNIVCMNGEGGEIPDMLGKYRENRGQQVASGRFGVSMELLNSARYLEIKVGQGAKPGEGGHLPGSKVTEMVAQARHCKPGIALISPSNHHDIYSIEDLCQIITELKTANPEARISVKIPVTSGVATIAVGVAKAGAHIVNISGFEGGTGAAREHAKKYVGLPVEIGVTQAHRGLVEAGLRHQVELWCDGGVRSGADVVKLICLGADRVGVGTVALMGVGCISCEQCHLDTCPRGISTQIRTVEEAKARGVKLFKPLQSDVEAENLARLLRAFGDQIRHILAGLGERKLADLVGRTDLLVQARGRDQVDLTDLLVPAPMDSAKSYCPVPRIVRRPLDNLTRLISDMALSTLGQECGFVQYKEENVRSVDRAVGTYLAGAMVRERAAGDRGKVELLLTSSVPGNGLCAFNIDGIGTVVEGGGQDGIAKGARGGEVCILKGVNILGQRVDGSVGKSLAYGALSGTIMVQNQADSRACVRMSGADAIFGGRITASVRDELGNIASRAHLKGFAFEYMTGGRAVVLGDPGPWMCAGMTGGVIYQCLYPEWNFGRENLQRRFSSGAHVVIKNLDEDDIVQVRELLGKYVSTLEQSFQKEEAVIVQGLADEAQERFVKIVPGKGTGIKPE